MFFFKKKISLKEFCHSKCDFIFSEGGKSLMFNFLDKCNDKSLIINHRGDYFENFTAVYRQLLGIALVKNCSREIALEGQFILNEYFESIGFTDKFTEIYRQYNSAFGSSSVDGIKPMVFTFIDNVIGTKPSDEDFKLFYDGFYSILSSLFNEIKKVKLVI